jgi:ATP-dependent Clp protease ATP-binding subunit ClpA
MIPSITKSKDSMSFDNFTNGARHAVALAQEQAKEFGHAEIGTAHLLLGLVLEGKGISASALASLGFEIAEARRLVRESAEQRGVPAPGHLMFTTAAKEAFDLSVREAALLGNNYVGTEHLLFGLIRQPADAACQVLTKLGIKPDSARSQAIMLLQGYLDGGFKLDNGGYRHFVDNDTYARTMVTALCGWTWVRKKLAANGEETNELPVCPECESIYSTLPKE